MRLGSGQKLVVESMNLGWRINHEYHLDGFFGMIVEGKQRIGKTSYCCQGLAEAFGTWEYVTEEDGNVHAYCKQPNYDRTKEWVLFKPKEFLELIFDIPIGTKEKAVYWSDAGFWLFVLDWYTPFVKSVAKYLQLAGRQFGAILFSTPNKKLISSKVMESMPELYVCRIIKRSNDTARFRPRLAKVYQRWDYPDGKKGGVRTRWIDHFNAILPDDFFNWYKPISDRYLKVGKQILKREYLKAQRKLSKKEEEEQMEDVHKVVGDPSRLKDLEEMMKQYGVD